MENCMTIKDLLEYLSTLPPETNIFNKTIKYLDYGTPENIYSPITIEEVCLVNYLEKIVSSTDEDSAEEDLTVKTQCEIADEVYCYLVWKKFDRPFPFEILRNNVVLLDRYIKECTKENNIKDLNRWVNVKEYITSNEFESLFEEELKKEMCQYKKAVVINAN